LKIKPLIAEKAKENLSIAGSSYSPKEGLQISAKVQKPIDTRSELAKLTNVSHDTIAKTPIK